LPGQPALPALRPPDNDNQNNQWFVLVRAVRGKFFFIRVIHFFRAVRGKFFSIP
jgi:hypothetical protein